MMSIDVRSQTGDDLADTALLKKLFEKAMKVMRIPCADGGGTRGLGYSSMSRKDVASGDR